MNHLKDQDLFYRKPSRRKQAIIAVLSTTAILAAAVLAWGNVLEVEADSASKGSAPIVNDITANMEIQLSDYKAAARESIASAMNHTASKLALISEVNLSAPVEKAKDADDASNESTDTAAHAEDAEENNAETAEEAVPEEENSDSGFNYSYALTCTAYAYVAGGYGASGNPAVVGTVAVDPSVIPLGTSLFIEGYGYAIANDTGGNIIGNTLDLVMNTEAECYQWGVRTVTVYVLD